MRNVPWTCLLVLAASTGCSTAPRSPAPAPTTAAVVGVDPDVRFMTGMIHHHAQAVLIAGWAKSRGASDPIRRLCERIVVAQRDEISLMSTWLVAKHLPVPDVSAGHAQALPGMDHSVHMPGMLTSQQLAELDAARGPDFDRLFLTFMIQHHRGALTMVEQLFGSYGGAQDAFVFRLASDISAGQTAEIDRMNIMLNAMPPAPGQ